MPSAFFEELVQARREGAAPGMQAEPEEVPERPYAGREATFTPVTPEDGLPASCDLCGALVVPPRRPAHADWHRLR